METEASFDHGVDWAGDGVAAYFYSETPPMTATFQDTLKLVGRIGADPSAFAHGAMADGVG
jgi:hypothetical protein